MPAVKHPLHAATWSEGEQQRGEAVDLHLQKYRATSTRKAEKPERKSPFVAGVLSTMTAQSMTPEKVKKNLKALITQGKSVLATKYTEEDDDSYLWVDEPLAQKWAVNTFALLKSVFGKTSDHYKAAKKHEDSITEHHKAEALQSVLKAALEAWDNGYVFEMRELAEATIEASLIDQAEELLAKGYHTAAAVLAGAVLEQHLRSLCSKYGVNEIGANGKPKTMDPINTDLCKASAYDLIQQKHITYLAGIRNNAAHGNGITPDDASALVRDAMLLCAKIR